MMAALVRHLLGWIHRPPPPAAREGRQEAAAAEHDGLLLVRVLAGNPATGAAILTCLTAADTRALRRLHLAVAGAVAAVPWDDTDTLVTDVVRWRAALPAAEGAAVVWRERADELTKARAAAALVGIRRLDLCSCRFITDDLLRSLPPSLCTLSVHGCHGLTAFASFAHLRALTSLDVSRASLGAIQGDRLPPSLQELDFSDSTLYGSFAGASLTHLTQLRVLRAAGSKLDAGMVASLPPSLEELHVAMCKRLSASASFAHLHALHTLDVAQCAVGDAALASLPPSLVSLHASGCHELSAAAALPHLPALRGLDVGYTSVGNALVRSLPAGLEELHIVECSGVTAGVTLDHVPALRVLHGFNTALAPGVLAACRARGCIVPDAGSLRGHAGIVKALAVLRDGRLASGDANGEVRMWDVASGHATAVFNVHDNNAVTSLAALLDGHRLAMGVDACNAPPFSGRVEVWDVGNTPPSCRAGVDCGREVPALAALGDGRLAAGCGDGKVRVVDVDAGAVAAVLEGPAGCVAALALLPYGRLACGAYGRAVRVWDVDARTCVATLAGHTGEVVLLAVLADGRLVSGAGDNTARLWDVRTHACVGVLAGHTGTVRALVALPDGRLVTGSDDGSIRLWDTRAAVLAASSLPASTVPMVVVANGQVLSDNTTLLLLPDGRLACTGWWRADEAVHLLNVPPPPTYE